ncbi:acid phosphatase [Neohortaea acidophila]|uniref:Acid phosphatase n=1 Tax=Neohortaea acidophila TaxID=245834 RepID=A0A6A6PIW7_9PEZI|nr:acid phosphatase [Neohortaea acidophila]KAF2479959.1 acid phosphatase [Neohortaea acidophila]
MSQWHRLLFFALLGLIFAHAFITTVMRSSATAVPQFLLALSFLPDTGAYRDYEACGAKLDVSLDWHPPPKTQVNDLDKVLHSQGVYGFIFNSSDGPKNDYNFCNMPRANPETYRVPGERYTLEYVEVVSRHHKRTPYAANLLSEEEMGAWACDDEMMFYGAAPIRRGTASTYWTVYSTDFNPFSPNGTNVNCQFPQITSDGLFDSYRHGTDMRAVYVDLLEWYPETYEQYTMHYRVTNNHITSQVASRMILGSWREQESQQVAILVQPAQFDSLEPRYPCPAAKRLLDSYGPGSDSSQWQEHLTQSAALKQRLDSITGVDPKDNAWSDSWDHYFDNLAARTCHHKPLPCSKDDPSNCVTQEDADHVFRLGQYEYSYIYRDSPESLRASVASYGVYFAELVQNLRHMMETQDAADEPTTSSRMQWRVNIAHDGSIARILSILQVSQMVWPGMGAEVIFELYSKEPERAGGMKCYYLRVLWGGQVLRSSHPDFRYFDMIPVGTFLAYVDGLVGIKGEKIPGLCAGNL